MWNARLGAAPEPRVDCLQLPDDSWEPAILQPAPMQWRPPPREGRASQNAAASAQAVTTVNLPLVLDVTGLWGAGGGGSGGRLRHAHFADGENRKPRPAEAQKSQARGGAPARGQGHSGKLPLHLPLAHRPGQRPPRLLPHHVFRGSPKPVKQCQPGAPRPPASLPASWGSLPLRRGVGSHLLHVDPAADLREVRVVGL